MFPTKSSGILKEPQVTETSVASSPSLSVQDEKQLATPSSESINLEGQIPSPPPYHVFSRSRKMQMVYLVSLAAIFSPLSSNIYFPALGLISKVSVGSCSTKAKFIELTHFIFDVGLEGFHVPCYFDCHGVYDCSRTRP